ncbi:MAG: HIT domain-containing protein [Patescibacteria group bacterium]
MSDFSKYLVKDYKYWHLSVHPNQGYLGRCVVWCKRQDALDLADATVEEREELLIILQSLRGAMKKVFRADWFNYAFLGNETRHLHGHFVPRYSSPRQFHGIEFVDERWGHNWQTDEDFISTPELWGAVRLKLIEALKQS